jgi:hypothetical protein
VIVSACAVSGLAAAGVTIMKAGATISAAAAKAIESFLIVSSCRNDGEQRTSDRFVPALDSVVAGN